MKYNLVEIPNIKTEDYRFTKLDFLEKEFHIAEEANVNLKHLEQNHLIFVNGIYKENLSRLADITIGKSKKFVEEDNLISRLNRSNSKEIIEISTKTKNLEIKITHINNVSSNITFPRIKIMSKENSILNVLEEFIDYKDHLYCAVSFLEFEVGKDSIVTHARVQNQNLSSYHLGRIIAKLKKNSKFISFIMNKGALISRSEVDVSLREEGSSVELYGLYTLNGDQHSSNYSKINHEVNNTSSTQVYNGLLDNQSHGVFRGKIVVEGGIKNISSRQLNKNLILGEDAVVNSMPQLEINSNDVLCSHGSSIGQISKEELFYLKSRGIKEPQAKKMICKGFCLETINKLNSDARKFVLNFL